MTHRRLALIGALAALALSWAASANAVTDAQDGNVTRTQQAQLKGAITDADSVMRVNKADSNGNLLTKENYPLNEKATSGVNVYLDTLSVNGRSLDSTGTVVNVTNYGRICLQLKMEGHHGAVSKEVRIGVTCIGSFSAVASDTVFSAPLAYQGYAAAPGDSVGPTADVAANSGNYLRTEAVATFLTSSAVSMTGNVTRAVTLEWINPGVPYVRWIFRVISDESTAPTQGAKFYLRANVGARAL